MEKVQMEQSNAVPDVANPSEEDKMIIIDLVSEPSTSSIGPSKRCISPVEQLPEESTAGSYREIKKLKTEDEPKNDVDESKSDEDNEAKKEDESKSEAHGVLKIPEVLRYNFGTLDFELGDCPIGLKFWFDPENSQSTKFFLKLHNDNGDWRKDGKFVLIEQKGLDFPKACYINFDKIQEKLEKSIKNKKTRIWLDLRNFDRILSNSSQNILSQNVLSFVTHFSFGRGLSSQSPEMEPHLLLQFANSHLPNLEYFSMNNNNLVTFGQEFRLKNYKWNKGLNISTLRLINQKLKFPLVLITTLMKKSRELKHIYGFPLHFLKEFSREEQERFNGICLHSIFIRRDIYHKKEVGAIDYFRDLSRLQNQKKWNTLETLDTRLFFLDCSSESRNKCIIKLSNIILRHELSLLTLKIEPESSRSIQMPKLKNLKTLQFFMTRVCSSSGSSSSFFPKGFDLPSKFPQLSTVEILLDFNGKKHKNPPPILLEKQFPPEIFQPGVTFNKVKSLKLHGFTVPVCMPIIADLFQNIKVLRLHNTLEEIAAVLPSCYKAWPKLEFLQLEIDDDTTHGNLDAPFLGMSERQCEKLRKEEDTQKQQEEILDNVNDDDRKNLCIFELRELRLLKIILRPAEKTDYKLAILTKIGGLALALSDGGGIVKNKLQVRVAFDERVSAREKRHMISSLAPMMPFPFFTIEY